MIIRLRYGREHRIADLRGLRCQDLRPDLPRHPVGVEALVNAALDKPVSGPALVERARGARRVVILVPDATRKATLSQVLPLVLARLARAQVAPEHITVLVACGTHPPADAATLAALLGELPAGTTVVQHDAHDDAALVAVGSLPTGLSIRLHRTVAEADLLLAISTVQHHYFAGFGGGPKLVFPGVAGYEEIQVNHGRVLDLTVRPPRRHPSCEPGVIAGNPVAEEIATAASLRPPDLALLMVMGEDGVPAWAESGPLAVVFPRACAQVRGWFEVEAGPFRRMVVSAGGYPGDHSLIQAHKALDAACRFAEPGAEVLFAAACDGGAGSPALEPFLADPRPGVIIASLAERYVQYGHTLLRLVEKTSRFRVHMLSEMPADLVRRLGMEPAPDFSAALDRWRDDSPGEVVGLMAGAAVFPRQRG